MNTKADPTVVKVMTALAMLADVEKSLRFLAAVGVVKDESVVKGCRKFVKDHPEIQAWVDKNTIADNECSNAEVSRSARLLAQVGSTDGLCPGGTEKRNCNG